MIDIGYYESLSDDEKVRFIFCLDDLNPENVVFLLDVAKQANEYDLARIEAIKSLGVYALTSDADEQEAVSSELIDLAKYDNNDDVRNYALQSLELLRNVENIPREIAGIVLGADEDDLVREAAYAVIVSQRNNPDAKAILQKLVGDAMFGKSAVRDLA